MRTGIRTELVDEESLTFDELMSGIISLCISLRTKSLQQSLWYQD